MDSRIAVAVGLAAVLAAALAPISTFKPAFAAEVAASITQGSVSKTTDAYSPNPLNVNVGDTVTWTNNDPPNTHTVTSGNPSDGPDGKFGGTPDNPFSELIPSGQTFSFTFNEAGEFPYYCTLHVNMVGTVVVSEGDGGNGDNGEQPTSFSVTATADGNDYEITGSGDASATAATINPNESVEIQFDGSGAVELTLPTDMIDDISAVNDEEPTIVSENATHTTISFEVPEGESTVTIQGGFVVPEFPVIAAILAASIAGIIGYTRFARNGTGFFGRA
jgi:plastocyanin